MPQRTLLKMQFKKLRRRLALLPSKQRQSESKLLEMLILLNKNNILINKTKAKKKNSISTFAILKKFHVFYAFFFVALPNLFRLFFLRKTFPTEKNPYVITSLILFVFSV